MNKHLAIAFENRFLYNVEQYVKAYEILIKSDYKQEANNYALCLYASFLGFLHTVFSNNRIICSMIFNNLSINPNIIQKVSNYIYSDKEDKQHDSVCYCYDVATSIPYKRIEYVMNKLFKLHNRIAKTCTTTDEKQKIEETKNLMLRIKPRFMKKETSK